MAGLRRRLRACVIAWIFIQAASLSVLLPRDCCADHRPTLREETGAPCHTRNAAQDDRKCVLRGACNGPIAALAALIPQLGIPPVSPALPQDAVVVPADEPRAGTPVALQSPPDPPPPRA
jgi:hypothetical protein